MAARAVVTSQLVRTSPLLGLLGLQAQHTAAVNFSPSRDGPRRWPQSGSGRHNTWHFKHIFTRLIGPATADPPPVVLDVGNCRLSVRSFEPVELLGAGVEAGSWALSGDDHDDGVGSGQEALLEG